ncbi:MAG: hypothetical protein IT535_00350 [Bauldia sp.]|nr:hypothetical protein [Bauldia sp.]
MTDFQCRAETLIQPGLLHIGAIALLFIAAGPVHSQQSGDPLDSLLDRLVADQDAIALQDPGHFYSYYELGTFDVGSFDQSSAVEALNEELRDNRALDCSFAPYRPGEPARLGMVNLLLGAGQQTEAERIRELPPDRLIGAVLRSWEGIPGDILDCNVSLGRLYFDNGRVLTVYYDGRVDLSDSAPNVPSMLRLAPLDAFRRDTVRALPELNAGD